MKEFDESDYDRVWNQFNRIFDFKPSVEPKYWPGILEPTPSFTISLTESDYGTSPDEIDLVDFFQMSFNKLSGENRIRYILDWQHTCYYAPDVFTNAPWVFPDGDYAICLNEDMTVGTFGHPWEQTICVFGKELVDITRKALPREFSKVLREIT